MKSPPRVCSIDCSNSGHSPFPSKWPVPRQSFKALILIGFLWQSNCEEIVLFISFDFAASKCPINCLFVLLSGDMESRAPSPPSPACLSFHATVPYSFCICPCTELRIFFMWEFPQVPLLNSHFAVSFLSWGKQHIILQKVHLWLNSWMQKGSYMNIY